MILTMNGNLEKSFSKQIKKNDCSTKTVTLGQISDTQVKERHFFLICTKDHKV